MVMSTAKCRPVLSSERAPYMKKQVLVRLKNMYIWSWAPKGSPTPRFTGRLTVAHKFNSTPLHSTSEQSAGLTELEYLYNTREQGNINIYLTAIGF
jgi:hypothetical protein